MIDPEPTAPPRLASSGEGGVPWHPSVPWVVAALLVAIGLLRSAIPQVLDADRTFRWWFDGAPVVIGYALWAILAGPLYRLYRRVVSDPRRRRAITLGVLVAVAVAGVHMLIASMLFLVRYAGDGSFVGLLRHFVPSMLVGWVSSFVELVAMVGAFTAFHLWRRVRDEQVRVSEMARELSDAQLRALRMQLHPHFLFNALHSVASLMEESVEDAHRVLARLGTLLRRMLDEDRDARIPLERELGYVRDYLDIEQTRFKDRLRVTYDVDASTHDALVPNLVLQPLVENAIKHGVGRTTRGVSIEIRCRCVDDAIELAVLDDGVGIGASPRGSGNGIGLRNVRQRLERMYDHGASLELVPGEGAGTVARVRIPFEPGLEASP